MSLMPIQEKIQSVDPHVVLQQKIRRNSKKHTFFPGAEANRNRLQVLSKNLLNTDSKLKLFWDILIVFNTVVLAFLIPYQLSFLSDISFFWWYYFSIVFCMDIILNFNITHYTEGILINRRKEIALNYLKNHFFADLLSGFPFELFFIDQMNRHADSIQAYTDNSELIRLLLLLKLVKLYKIPRVTYQIQLHYSGPIVNTLLKIFNYLLTAILSAHWMCCTFNMLYAYEFQNSNDYAGIVITDNYTRYLRLFEKVIQTMTSVGYGDRVSLSPIERIVNIGFMCFTSGFLGVFVGAIKLAIEKSTENTIFFRKIIRNFTIFHNNHKFPRFLRSRILYYIRHLKYSYNENLLKEEDIIKLLSIPLREQIFLFTRGHLLIKLPQFQDLSQACLKALGYKMNLNFYAPNDRIIRQGELTSDVYFVFSGQISIVHEETETNFVNLSKNAHFGEIGFFRKTQRTASAISRSFSEVFALSRFNFDKSLESMPKDNEKLLILLRNLNNYGLYYLGIKCYLCSNIGHVARDCSDCIIKPNIEEIVSVVQKKRNASKIAGFKRKNPECDYLKGYSAHNAIGNSEVWNENIEDRVYLKKKMIQYNHSVRSINRENSRLFTLINDISQKDLDKEMSEESDESEKNFLDFSMFKIEKRDSMNNLADSISYFRRV